MAFTSNLGAGWQSACTAHRGHNRMKIVVFGLAISSSWGNGHATLWRGLCARARRARPRVVFFERDVPYYAAHRDLWALPDGRLHFYPAWDDVAAAGAARARRMPMSASSPRSARTRQVRRICCSTHAPRRVFYDLDTPVTLDRIARGETGRLHRPARVGRLRSRAQLHRRDRPSTSCASELGARRAMPLYGSVDPAVHQPVAPVDRFHADLSYLGTYVGRSPGRRRAAVPRAGAAAAERAVRARRIAVPDRFPVDDERLATCAMSRRTSIPRSTARRG